MSINVSFSVTASGTVPLAYQWESGSTLLSNSSRITASTSTDYFTSSLRINNVQLTDTGSYRVNVGNIAGSATSSYAALNIIYTLYPPLVIFHPADQITYPSLAVSFSVTVVGTTPLGYQWISGSTNLSDGSRITGSNSSSLRINNVQETDTGSYRCYITNSAGGDYSNYAVLYLLDPVITSSVTDSTSSVSMAFYAGSLSTDEPIPDITGSVAVGFYSGSLYTTTYEATASSDTASIGSPDVIANVGTIGFYSGSIFETTLALTASGESASVVSIGIDGGFIFTSTTPRSGSNESASVVSIGLDGGLIVTRTVASSHLEYVSNVTVGFLSGSLDSI